MNSLCTTFLGLSLVLACAAAIAGQPVERFYHFEADTYWTSEVGAIPPATYVAAHLMQVNATTPYCNGTNDVLALTFAAPIQHEVDASQILVLVCAVSEPPVSHGCRVYTPPFPDDVDDPPVTPNCAVLQPGDEQNERRTVLVMGSFTSFAGERMIRGPQGFTLNAFSVAAQGRLLPKVTSPGDVDLERGDRHSWSWQADSTDVLGYGRGPFLADVTLLNLTAPLNTAAADPNGCAAVHPAATYAVRLLFASPVHERAASGGLAPFGTDADAATALFSLVVGEERETPSPDRVVGLADVDGDNVIDVCVEGAGGEPQVAAVVINCTAGELLAPEGFPCNTSIVAELEPFQGPAPEVADDVSLCFELDPADCPSASHATPVLQRVLAPVLAVTAAVVLALPV